MCWGIFHCYYHFHVSKWLLEVQIVTCMRTQKKNFSGPWLCFFLSKWQIKMESSGFILNHILLEIRRHILQRIIQQQPFKSIKKRKVELHSISTIVYNILLALYKIQKERSVHKMNKNHSNNALIIKGYSSCHVRCFFH